MHERRLVYGPVGSNPSCNDLMEWNAMKPVVFRSRAKCVWGLALALVAGCTSAHVHRELPQNHPASPSAPSSGNSAIANPFEQLPTFESPRAGTSPAAMPGMDHGMDAMSGMDEGSKSLPQADVQYTCPMHPDIVQNTPGSCPKCGMTLKPMASPSKDGKL